MRRVIAKLSVVLCVAACYGGELLPAPDDDISPPVLDGGNTSDAKDASTSEGSVSAEGGGECVGPLCQRYVFLTSTVRKGNFGGMAEADVACGIAAASGDARLRGRTFRAWLSEGSTSAVSRLEAVGIYVRLDGVVVAKSVTDLADGSLESVIALDENVVMHAGVNVWTGSTVDGAPSAKECNAWGSNNSGDTGTAGTTTFADGRWSQYVDLPCHQEAHLYCIEDPPQQ